MEERSKEGEWRRGYYRPTTGWFCHSEGVRRASARSVIGRYNEEAIISLLSKQRVAAGTNYLVIDLEEQGPRIAA